MVLDLSDKNLIDEIINSYSDTVMRIALQHVRNVQEAEDIMQEVFLALLNKTNFKNAEHLKAWLIRVTINKCKDYHRSKRKKLVPLESVRSIAVTAEQESVLEEIFALPPIDRDIIYLHYYEGYGAAEIGKIIKKSENAVYVRLMRAREKLKNILESGVNGDE